MLVGRADDMAMGSGMIDYKELHGKNFFFTYEDCCFTAESGAHEGAGVEPGKEQFFGAVSTNLDCIRSEGGYTLLPQSAVGQMLRDLRNLRGLSARKALLYLGQMLVNSGKYLTRTMQELLQLCEQHTVGLSES
jgi:hypothetical protein